MMVWKWFKEGIKMSKEVQELVENIAKVMKLENGGRSKYTIKELRDKLVTRFDKDLVNAAIVEFVKDEYIEY